MYSDIRNQNTLYVIVSVCLRRSWLSKQMVLLKTQNCLRKAESASLDTYWFIKNKWIFRKTGSTPLIYQALENLNIKLCFQSIMTWFSRDSYTRIQEHIKDIFYSCHHKDRETHT